MWLKFFRSDWLGAGPDRKRLENLSTPCTKVANLKFNSRSFFWKYLYKHCRKDKIASWCPPARPLWLFVDYIVQRTMPWFSQLFLSQPVQSPIGCTSWHPSDPNGGDLPTWSFLHFPWFLIEICTLWKHAWTWKDSKLANWGIHIIGTQFLLSL